jgi:hypothetical protein
MRNVPAYSCYRCAAPFMAEYASAADDWRVAQRLLQQADQATLELARRRAEAADRRLGEISRQIQAGECDACQRERHAAAVEFIRASEVVRFFPGPRELDSAKYAREAYDLATRPRRPVGVSSDQRRDRRT